MKKISVMIVEDSRVICEFLKHIIGSDPRLEVAAVAGSGEEALKLLPRVRPDIISLDIRLPGMNGLEVTQRIMTEHPTPIVVVSSDVEDDELKISMNALRAGALAVVQKPVGMAHADYEELAASLCTKLVIMSQVRVIRQRFRTFVPTSQSAVVRPPRIPPKDVTPSVLGIVASTGGPSALVRVLGDLDPRTAPPILLVQHITPSFLRGFVVWLGDELPKLRVMEAVHGAPLSPRTVYVAPADRHLTCTPDGVMQFTDSPPLAAQKPSGTILFRSLAAMGSAAAGVLLTGMGEDGAQGLLEMNRAGGYTIAEDESTAVVYGMPAAAARLGAASAILPLPEVGPRLNLLFAPKKSAHD